MPNRLLFCALLLVSIALTITATKIDDGARLKKALVVGASGATGRAVLRQLLLDETFGSVRSVGRRSVRPLLDAMELDRERVASVFSEVVANDLSVLPADTFVEDDQGGFDVVFCALGTTLKNAGSKEAFFAIDHDLLIAVAQQARAAGVPAFAYVSSIGAAADSWFFYPHTKGQNEADLAALGFPRLGIFRPALLLSNRDELRPIEHLAQILAPAFDLVLPKTYRSIPVEAVANAMIRSFKSGSWPAIFENDQIHDLAE